MKAVTRHWLLKTRHQQMSIYGTLFFQPVSEKVSLCNSKNLGNTVENYSDRTENFHPITVILLYLLPSFFLAMCVLASARTHIFLPKKNFFFYIFLSFGFRSIILYRPSQFSINFIVNAGVEFRARLCALRHCNL